MIHVSGVIVRFDFPLVPNVPVANILSSISRTAADALDLQL